jgi:peptide/nickel transport system permease protein
LPRTLLLVLAAVVNSRLIAIAVGIYQATHRNTWVDHALTGIVYFLYSMASFWLGIILIFAFADNLGWLPAGGIANPADLHPGPGAFARHPVLPVATLVLLTVAGWSRHVRSSMTEALVQDYICTAEARGKMFDAHAVHVYGLRGSRGAGG